MMLKEVEGLRGEQIAYQNMMPYILFYLLVAVGSGFATVYRESSAMANPKSGEVRRGLIRIVSQVVFFLSFVYLFLIGSLNVHGGYLSAVDQKINLLAGDNLVCWDQFIGPRFYGSKYSVFFWTTAIATCTGVLLAIWLVWDKRHPRWFFVLVGFETLLFLILFVLFNNEGQRVAVYAQHIFGIWAGQTAQGT